MRRRRKKDKNCYLPSADCIVLELMQLMDVYWYIDVIMVVLTFVMKQYCVPVVSSSSSDIFQLFHNNNNK